MNKIYDADDKAQEERTLDGRVMFQSHRERMAYDWNKITSPIFRVKKIAVWSGEIGTENPVSAFVDCGRWIAQCNCGGYEYVTDKDPIFFCHECGNELTGGRSRPVIFPENKAAIEDELLTREIIEIPALANAPATYRARMAIPVDKPRSWRG